MFEKLKEVYLFREVLINFVVQELKVRYRKSILGFFWSLLNPILTMAVTSIVFAQIMRFNLNDFVVFIFSALLPWGFISASIDQSTMSLIKAEGFIKKIYIPKIIFPLSMVASNFVNMLLSMISLFAIMLFLGAKITWALLFLPIAFLITFIAVTGISLILSTVCVYFRDIIHISTVVTSVFFYLTPIIYPIEYIPAQYRIFVDLNPFYYLTDLFRGPIYNGKLPDTMSIMISLAFSIIVLYVGLKLIINRDRDIVFRL